MSGIADVARRAGVSKATASRALTGHGYVSAETRTRVQDAARALGYVASSNAASLVTGRTRNIGVIMPYLNRWFFAEVLEGIQDALLEHGLDLTLYDARPGTVGRTRIFEDFLARKRFDGLIAVGLEPENRELERLLSIGRPLVSVVGDARDSSAVSIDDDHAARRATEHLIGLGHRRIAFVGGNVGAHWAEVDRRRLRGYEAAMTTGGLGDEVRHMSSEVTLPGGYAVSVDLLGDAARRPTGIVGVCDEVAIGAIIAARRLGIQVPGDLSVVGIDDHEFAEMFALTTLAQDPREQGAAAVALLLQHVSDPDSKPVELTLRARLIVRSSTGPVDRASSAIEAGTGSR
ncbi:LacI family DNA-binding transcriptional regulator [Microbacterium sp. CJ88]|uniref:LacI family DNA-binding transcriptional regulator n=1 Tax=Microbacterium sp. CJ88 TaxID=3445672 RepID=UPI003F657EF1